MASDWIKSRDRDFQAQVDQLVHSIDERLDVWGLVAEDLIALRQGKAEFDAMLAEQAAQAVVYHAVVAEKQAKRHQLERTLRGMVRRINNHPGMTDTLRVTMELASPIHSRSQAASQDTACQTVERRHMTLRSQGSSSGSKEETQP